MNGERHILVFPGGAYWMHADHEAEPVAEWLESLGFTASVFRYPVRVRHPLPLDATRAEIARVREGGATWVGVLGFSAGAHAAGLAALAPGAAPNQRVDAAILCYPVVSMVTETHAGSRTTLLGPDAGPQLRAATSLERLVTPQSPPCFIWHTAQDPDVPVQHSYLLATALADAGVAHNLHVFSGDIHGIGLAPEPGDPAHAWTALCAAWLAQFQPKA